MGHITGQSALNGVRRERSKLLMDSIKHPDYFHVVHTGSDVKDEMPFEKSHCILLREEVDKYKYCIVIDGHVSSWGRPELVLLSKCVPLVVESRFRPLYAYWVPWVHYVPVKNDQSDLLE